MSCEIRKEIASRVRELRECCNISVATLADLINISSDDYLKMEEGNIDFPASALYEIANALKADLTEILTGRPAHVNVFSVTRSGTGVIVKRRDQYGYENLSANFINKKCEPFIVTVPVSSGVPEQNSHFGQEFIYMLEGEMTVKVLDSEVRLAVGDSIYLDSTKAHSMKTIGDTPAKFLDVIL